MSGHNQPAFSLVIGSEDISITLNVLFANNQATITNSFLGDIKQVAAVMQKYPDIVVTIEGHTDSQASEQYNRQLSQRRADAVRQELIKYGIDATRLLAVGYGESKPIADNSTATGRAKTVVWWQQLRLSKIFLLLLKTV